MPYPQLDRARLAIEPLAQRDSKSQFQTIALDPDAPPPPLEGGRDWLDELVARIRAARSANRPVIMTYGAHLIKNGLTPVLIRLIEHGHVTHLATNGAGSIHDWEFAYCGRTEEDVRRYVADGRFGIWRETGFAINAALICGACRDMGYGEAVGAAILDNGFDVPRRDAIRARLGALAKGAPCDDNDAVLLEALRAIEQLGLPEGWVEVRHAYPQYSVQAAARRLGVPLSVMPGIGYDIIHSSPLSGGAALGKAAMRDFLAFADAVGRLEGGVYLSVGSAIMAPMTFEKSLSMARNLARQEGRRIDDFLLVVNDIQPGAWDWSQGEPPKDNPAYYLRFCKSYARMGGQFRYVCLDNRAFLCNLLRQLES